MTESAERRLGTLSQLFPHGVTTTLDMATRLAEEGVRNIAVSEMRILSAREGPQDFVVAHFDAAWVTPDLEVREGHRRDYEISFLLLKSSDDLRFLDLKRYSVAQLVPGKIGPLDLTRLPVTQFASATFMISEFVQYLSELGVDMVLPNGITSLEILPTETVIKQIIDRLRDRWKVILAYGSPYYGMENPAV